MLDWLRYYIINQKIRGSNFHSPNVVELEKKTYYSLSKQESNPLQSLVIRRLLYGFQLAWVFPYMLHIIWFLVELGFSF